MISDSYTPSANQTVFTFTFPYITAPNLKVEIKIGPNGTLTQTTDWTLTGVQEITLGASHAALTPDDTVVISRITPIDAPIVEFSSPSTLRSREINLAISQLLYNLQEGGGSGGGGGGTPEGNFLSKNAAGTRWLAESLRLTELADPEVDTDAATKGWTTNQITASGSIPPYTIANAGQGLQVDAAGVAGWGNIDGGVSLFRVKLNTTGSPAFADGGHPLEQASAAYGTTATSRFNSNSAPDFRVPLEFGYTRSFFGTAPTLVGDYDLQLAAGVFEITVVGSVRSLALDTGVDHQTTAKVCITGADGSFEYDRRPNMKLGFGGATNPFQLSQAFTLKCYVASAIGTTINLRGGRNNPSDAVLDDATLMFIREVR